MKEPHQLGFGFDEMLEAQRTAHLPSAMEQAIPYYRGLIEKHHAAMLAGDVETTMAIRKEADDLSYKANGNDVATRGDPDASDYVLERATAAGPGSVPLWGQTGSYTIDVDGMKVRIEQEGMFGIGAGFSFWPGFSAHAVDYDKPLLSETGFRSFVGAQGSVVSDLTPENYAGEMIRAYMQEAKGKPRDIGKSYVEREMERRVATARKGELQP